MFFFLFINNCIIELTSFFTFIDTHPALKEKRGGGERVQSPKRKKKIEHSEFVSFRITDKSHLNLSNAAKLSLGEPDQGNRRDCLSKSLPVFIQSNLAFLFLSLDAQPWSQQESMFPAPWLLTSLLTWFPTEVPTSGLPWRSSRCRRCRATNTSRRRRAPPSRRSRFPPHCQQRTTADRR